MIDTQLSYSIAKPAKAKIVLLFLTFFVKEIALNTLNNKIWILYISNSTIDEYELFLI